LTTRSLRIRYHVPVVRLATKAEPLCTALRMESSCALSVAHRSFTATLAAKANLGNHYDNLQRI